MRTASWVIVPTPGANSLMVTHVALTRGWRHVAAAIGGNMVGIVLLGSLALAGMAVVLQAFPWMRLAIHVAGGAYLSAFPVVNITPTRIYKVFPYGIIDPEVLNLDQLGGLTKGY